MQGQFEGKVVLVTGGSSGMGRATSIAFAREGARVVVADVDVAGGDETVRLIHEFGGEAQFICSDVSLAADVEALIATTVVSFGRLDCAFNNAGIDEEHGLLTGCSSEQWDRILDINLKGIFLCMKYEIPELVRVGGGAIVNTASAAGLRGSRGHPVYTASKHGVVGLTRAAALDHAKQRIRVNAVCPGAIQTPMYIQRVGSDPDHDSLIAAGIPLGRLGQAEDVAEAVLWLCSERASFITGHTLVIDGGDDV